MYAVQRRACTTMAALGSFQKHDVPRRVPAWDACKTRLLANTHVAAFRYHELSCVRPSTEQCSCPRLSFHMRWAGPRREVGSLGGLGRTDRDDSIGVAFLSEPTSMCGGRLSVLPWAVKPTEVGATVREGAPSTHQFNPYCTRTSSPVSHIHSSPLRSLISPRRSSGIAQHGGQLPQDKASIHPCVQAGRDNRSFLHTSTDRLSRPSPVQRNLTPPALTPPPTCYFPAPCCPPCLQQP